MVKINNRLEDDDDGEGFFDISGVDGAISALAVTGGADEHPERRQKVAIILNDTIAYEIPFLTY